MLIGKLMILMAVVFLGQGKRRSKGHIFKCCTFKRNFVQHRHPLADRDPEWGSETTTKLGSLDLLELDANGAGSMFLVELPEPTRVVPIRLAGSGSQFTVQRPPGVAARVHLTGWGSGVVFDDQTASGNTQLQSPNYEGAARRYDLEVSGTGSIIAVAAG